jgi:hypothetical protein
MVAVRTPFTSVQDCSLFIEAEQSARQEIRELVASRKSYQDFLTLRKDADPDIPIYKQAKAEYAELK